jgi:AraC family transcriptional regulator, positive regulator of tynA and feaB
MRFAPIGASLTLRLPRKSVRSHFGFEPQGGVSRQRTRASRLLFDLIRNADMEAASSSADIYMQFAVYDLVGALFAPSDPRSLASGSDKLFQRIFGVIKDGFSDPDFGAVEVAAEAGVPQAISCRLSGCSIVVLPLRWCFSSSGSRR